MADQGVLTFNLPISNGAVNANDCVIILRGYDAAVAGSNAQLAQTSIQSITNLFANTPSLTLKLGPNQVDPANSSALTVAQGTLFFSNTFGYYAVANNTTKRFALSSF